MQNIQLSFCDDEKIAWHCAKTAVRSLYKEVSLYPKPGLVSFVDSGCHADMDGALFFRSLLGLRRYFFKISLASIQKGTHRDLVELGKEAECKMLQITNGVNTHKGAIFALGILCASLSKLIKTRSVFYPADLQQTIVQDWAEYLNKHHKQEASHGEVVRNKYKICSAKELAISGYQPVFKIFERLSHLEIDDWRFYGLLAYKELLLCIDDTNVLYRTGRSGLRFARNSIKDKIFPDNQNRSFREGIYLHQLFSKKNISPGGVADMLGLLYYLRQIFVRIG